MELPMSPPLPKEATHGSFGEPPAEDSRRQPGVAVAEGVLQKALSMISMFLYSLPSESFVTFKMLLPLITTSASPSDVQCSKIYLLLCFCSIYCFFFHFNVRSVRPDRLVYFGFVTPEGGQRARAVADGLLHRTLYKIATLQYFLRLPSGTFLAFKMVLPIITTSDGHPSDVQSLLIQLLFGLCALSCFFLHFTVRFLGPDDAIYCRFVAPKGLSDFVRAIISVVVFVALGFMDPTVTNGLFPGQEEEEEIIFWPWMVVIVCSGLFLVFPR